MAPVDDELLRIHRSSEDVFSTSVVTSVRFADLIGSIHFTPDSWMPPVEAWSLGKAAYFPRAYRAAVVQVLLSHRRRRSVPSDVWMHVLSYTHRQLATFRSAPVLIVAPGTGSSTRMAPLRRKASTASLRTRSDDVSTWTEKSATSG